MILSILIACFIKNNYLIGIIALIITILITNLAIRKKIATVIVTVGLALIISMCISTYYSHFTKDNIDVGSGVPKEAFVVMGLQDYMGLKNGWYDGYTLQVFRQNNYSTKLTKEQSKKDLDKRIYELKNSPFKAIKFFEKKLISTWSDSTFQSLWIAPWKNQTNKELKYFYRDSKKNLVRIISSIITQIILICSLLNCLKKNNNLEYKTYSIVAILFFIGGFWFHLVWETKSQYVWQYIETLIPVAGMELNALFILMDGEKIMQVVLSLIVYIIAILGATFILFNKHQKVTKKKLSILLLLAIIFFCFLYKLGSFPNVFLDEANGFYDAYSLAQYGVDSHLIKFPIYLQSYAGQGQSVLLAYISILFFKLFGFSLFSFRLSLVVVAIVAILFTCYTLNQYYSKFLAPVMLSLCSAPYLTVEARYGMDCNISLWISLIIINCLLIGIKAKRPIIPITLFYIFCGILAYSYNVAWIYLAFSIVCISILLYKEKIIVPKVIILEFILLSIEILPILLFAIRSNINFLNKTIRFGIFTIPELPMGRINASFIDFHGNILKNIFNNVFFGFRMLFLTSDGLTWNSLPNFNAYYSFAIIIFIIGLYWVLKNYKSIEARVLLILLFCNIPIWLIVQPNYNHWMFTHIPILLIIGVGIKILERVIPFKYLYGVYILFFLLFSHAYFTIPRYTGFDISSIKNVKYIRQVSEGKNVYFDGNDRNLLLVIRDFSGISPYEFQRTKDNPYSRKRLLFYDNMANYHKVNTESDVRKEELFLTTNRNISKKEFKLQKSNIYIGDTVYCLYKRVN